MAFLNEGGFDRTLRALIGLALLYAGWQVWTGPLAIGALVAGAIALVTGVVGWCAGYALFGWSTRRRQT